MIKNAFWKWSEKVVLIGTIAVGSFVNICLDVNIVIIGIVYGIIVGIITVVVFSLSTFIVKAFQFSWQLKNLVKYLIDQFVSSLLENVIEPPLVLQLHFIQVNLFPATQGKCWCFSEASVQKHVNNLVV